MPIKKINENVVIAAKSFNPSILSQLWLVEEGIMAKEEFTGQCIFSPVAVDIRTNEYQLLVIPDRLQLTFAQGVNDKSAIIKRVVEAITTKLSHTPFVAVGFNVTINFDSNSAENFPKLNKELTFCLSNPLAEYFNTADARFGFYCSKDFSGMRLKLDVKPTKAKNEFLAFNFNFHKDIQKENNTQEIIDFLGKWDVAEKQCDEIVNKFEETWSSQE